MTQLYPRGLRQDGVSEEGGEGVTPIDDLLHRPSPAELECLKLHGASYSISWRNRDGSYSRVSACPTRDRAEESARVFGWPGHKGTRWLYFLDDVRALWSKIRCRNPET